MPKTIVNRRSQRQNEPYRGLPSLPENDEARIELLLSSPLAAPRRPTHLSSLLSDLHGRDRRNERGIERVCLQRARRYGIKEKARFGREKYSFGGVTFIYDPIANKEVTSYRNTPASTTPCGTLAVLPERLAIKAEYETEDALEYHNACKAGICANPKLWGSHTVIVVDLSGSMRYDDVNGADSRAHGVWLVLAKELIKKQIESGTATYLDLVSVIGMRKHAVVLLECEPITWVLYNKFVKFSSWQDGVRPQGEGYFMPALEKAKELLQLGQSSTALSLFFCSDGSPSDKGQPFAETCANLGKKYGPRLSMAFLALTKENTPPTYWKVMEEMSDAAKRYGAEARFERPALCTDKIKSSITSLVSSQTVAKSGLAGGDGAYTPKRLVREDIEREEVGAMDLSVGGPNWSYFSDRSDTHYVDRVWVWNSVNEKMSYLRDPRCYQCHSSVPNCRLCASCGGAFVCHNCSFEDHVEDGDCKRYNEDLTSGFMIIRDEIPTFSVAIKKAVFGEGSERVVHQCCFLDNSGTILQHYAAKESRFVGDNIKVNDYGLNVMHENFLRSQDIAWGLANDFTTLLKTLVSDPEYGHLLYLPGIRFLRPLVLELTENGKPRNIHIEQRLSGKYEKFNNNMGYVKGQDNANLTPIAAQLKRALGEKITATSAFATQFQPLPGYGYEFIRTEDIPQAFSHYTWEKSKGQLIVVDLQGVMEEGKNDTREYVLTDPAIHSRDNKSTHNSLGRTNRGIAGMKAFWSNHTCTEACAFFGLTNHTQRIL